MTDFPTRAAGLERLAAFAPRAGRAYSGGRNVDTGPDTRGNTAKLSPYLRHRLVLETEVIEAARASAGPASEKFVEEVCWRTYWKGWLEARPSVWIAYRHDAARGHDRLATESGLRRAYHDATEGNTGIDAFDFWARELVANNWLHNHVRMSFASIWIFTLRLPWALGAEFFMRHLLDGDPASNTLSWRWVAGLHTPGKNYVARAEIIARASNGRFDPRGQLDEGAAPLTEDEPLPPPLRLSPNEPPPSGDVALLIHEDDLFPESLALPSRVRRIAFLPTTAARTDRGVAEPVAAFVRAAGQDALGRAAAHFDAPATTLDTVAEATGWADDLPIVAADAPVGPAADALDGIGGVRLVRRDWDARAWPYATKGFFQLRSRIPALLNERY